VDKAGDVLLAGLAALVLIGTLAAALHDASQAWDSPYYHLPFAARLSGVLRPGDYVFHAANAARIAGFPLLGERLQGLLWRLTGCPEAANLLAYASVPSLAWFAWRRFGIAPKLSVIGLFAIPLVQTHATSAYVDLPANAALSVLLLLTIETVAAREPPSNRTLALAFAAGAVAANMKALSHPLVALALVTLLACALPTLVARARHDGTRPAALLVMGAILLAFPIVFAAPLVDLVTLGNPYYPTRLTVLGHVLPGVENAYSDAPPWLAAAPRPLRFALSLIEVGLRPMTEERHWTVDMWMPADSMGNRMGGFFGAYVLLNAFNLVRAMVRDRSRFAARAGAAFGAVTAVVSVMPQSHELRYYMGWMIVLVLLNLRLAVREGNGRARVLGLEAAMAMAVVVLVTRGDYVRPVGTPLATLAHERADASLAGVKDGERICVAKEPWNLLWAAELHPPMRYVVVEAEEPSGCGGARLVE
jgi:hypothetical protein